MSSTSNGSDPDDLTDQILDAAANCALVLGFDRVTLAAIARHAGVSRPTVYRRWPDTRSVLAALLTRQILGAWRDVPATGAGRQAVVARIVAVAGRLRRDEVVMRVLHGAPDLAMVYIAERMGASQHALLDLGAGALELAQSDGSVRPGDPRRLAAMCLLITQSTIQSAQLVQAILDEDALAEELTDTLDRYLKP
jgi:AcrR family transcriptional regulator